MDKLDNKNENTIFFFGGMAKTIESGIFVFSLASPSRFDLVVSFFPSVIISGEGLLSYHSPLLHVDIIMPSQYCVTLVWRLVYTNHSKAFHKTTVAKICAPCPPTD